MRILILVLGLVLSGAVHAARVEGVRVAADGDATRVEIDLSEKRNAAVFSLPDPNRLVVDLRDTVLDSDLPAPPGPDLLVSKVRSGIRDKYNLRVVFELRDRTLYSHELVEGSGGRGVRLVVLLRSKSGSATARAANPSPAAGTPESRPSTPSVAGAPSSPSSAGRREEGPAKSPAPVAGATEARASAAPLAGTQANRSSSALPAGSSVGSPAAGAREPRATPAPVAGTPTSRPAPAQVAGASANRPPAGSATTMSANRSSDGRPATDPLASAAPNRPSAGSVATLPANRPSAGAPAGGQSADARLGAAPNRPSAASAATLPANRPSAGAPAARPSADALAGTPGNRASAAPAAAKPSTQAAAPAKEPPGRDVVVAIDAGHGGKDPGALGPRGVREKDVVLAIAKRLKKLIDAQPGMRAVMTRDGDYYLGLRERMDRAREAQADLFLSIHADAYRDRRVTGSSVYVLSDRGASSEAARWLAEQENSADLVGGVTLEDKDRLVKSVLLDLSQTATLQASTEAAQQMIAALRRVGQVKRKGVQSAGFVVLKSPDVPSILVETAFISNPMEERRLADPRHQQKLADAMLRGLEAFFRANPPDGTLLAQNARRRAGQSAALASSN